MYILAVLYLSFISAETRNLTRINLKFFEIQFETKWESVMKLDFKSFQKYLHFQRNKWKVIYLSNKSINQCLLNTLHYIKFKRFFSPAPKIATANRSVKYWKAHLNRFNGRIYNCKTLLFLHASKETHGGQIFILIY